MNWKLITPVVLTLLIGISSCGESEEAKKAPATEENSMESQLNGRWKLTKEEHKMTREKGVQYSKQPTNVILHIQKNGYFTIYDTFIDPKWKDKGLPLIERRSKGQWNLSGKTLTLNHIEDDTSFAEKLEITRLNDTELVTHGSDKKANIYKTYGK